MRATFDDDKSKCGAEKKPKMKLKLCHFAVSTGKAINFGISKGGGEESRLLNGGQLIADGNQNKAR